MAENQIDLCISVVTGSNPDVTRTCLTSVLASIGDSLTFELHVIDNASPEQWFASLDSISPHVRVRRNETRRGFGANHNSVIASVRARYYLLLNDDTVMQKGCCEQMVQIGDDNVHAGFLGPKLVNIDGTIQPSAHRFPSPQRALAELFLLNRIFGWVPIFDDYHSFAYDRPRAVDFLSGAALLVKNSTIDAVGLLDERFFMYSEESDWCLRGKKAGWQTLFVPSAQVAHYSGLSTVEFRAERSVEFLRSHEKFIRKHYGELGLFIFRLLNFGKHGVRAIFSRIGNWPEHKQRAELDTWLWSMGALQRPGLAELAMDPNSTKTRR